MKRLGATAYSLLCGWFLLGYLHTRLTVPVKITEFGVGTVLLFFLLLGLFGYVRRWKYNDLSAFSVVVIWGFDQYFEHWQPLIWGAPQARVDRYYQYFKNTIRVFPPSPHRIVPDLFHTVIGALILVCVFLLLHNIIALLRARPAASVSRSGGTRG